MYMLIVFLPLLNSILLGLFGRFIGKKGVMLITSIIFIISFFLSILIFFEIVFWHSLCHFKLWHWILCHELSIEFGFLFDAITATMCIVVFIISGLVHIYSFGYMSDDPHFIRFIMFLSLFTFFMVLIISADNFVQLFFGWECVGLSSYLLINFWYTRIQANKSGLKAIIVNKIGDIAVIIAIVALYLLTKSFDYIFIFNYVNFIDLTSVTHLFIYDFTLNLLILVNIMLFIGVIAKSAQLGLHTWLVDAMEGPTPVSALLHAATMVTVGVFCLIRCNILFTETPLILFYICLFGALTALFGSIVGLLQNDIKRVIAYSTCSQLGYMVLACGLTHYEAALYHLTNHAFFKALLFLTAGGVIHAINGKQDMREMGGLLKIQPILYISFFIGSVALMGLPFFSGFYSKDFILEFSMIFQSNDYNFYLYFLGIIGAFFTSIYSGRVLFLTFFTIPKTIIKINLLNLHNLSIFIYIPLVILSILSIFSGWFLKDLFLGIGTDFSEGSLTIYHNFNFFLYFLNIENINILIKILPNLLTLLGIFLSYFYCVKHTRFIIFNLLNYSFITNNWNNFFQKRLFFDYFYYFFFIKNSFIFSYSILYKLIDRGFYEIIGPYGLSIKLYNISKIVNILHKKEFYYLLMYFIQNIIILTSILIFYLFDYIIFFDFFVIFFLFLIVYTIGFEENRIRTYDVFKQ